MSAFGHDEPDLCGCGQKIWHKMPCLIRPLTCEFGTPASNYEHVPMKAALDSSVACIRCGQDLGDIN